MMRYSTTRTHSPLALLSSTLAVLLLPPLHSTDAASTRSSDQNSWSSSRRLPRVAQYHTQDPASGTYQYGYAGPHHSKSESSFNGVTRGGYSYVDANGLMQTVSYTADAENGFRVQASNLPQTQTLQQQDTPEVALAKRRHLDQLRRTQSPPPPSPPASSGWQQQQQPRAQARRALPSSRSPFFRLTSEEARALSLPRAPRPGLLEYEHNAIAEPVSGFSTSSSSFHELPPVVVPVLRDQPTVYAVPMHLMLRSSMSHSQDELGRYEYSYQGDTSAKTESRALDGTTRGAYSYIDANGLLQQVHYVADENGFRVLATNLP